MMRPSLSKYDYGYLKNGGVDWANANVGYYGAPHSMWYSLIPWFMPLAFKLSFAIAIVVVF